MQTHEDRENGSVCWQEERRQKGLVKGNILVVDDDESVRRPLSRILENNGYMVETVENGKQAIEASKKWFFNLALIDIRLPDMEGTELLNKLRNSEPRMVKIIITGYPSMENAIEAVNKGADGYVLKPVEVRKLLKLIENQLEKQRKNLKYSEMKVAEYIHARSEEIEHERD